MILLNIQARNIHFRKQREFFRIDFSLDFLGEGLYGKCTRQLHIILLLFALHHFLFFNILVSLGRYWLHVLHIPFIKGQTSNSYIALSAGYLFLKRHSNNGAKLRLLLGLLKYTDGSTASIPCLAHLYIAGNGIKRLLKTVSQLGSNDEKQAISRK